MDRRHVPNRRDVLDVRRVADSRRVVRRIVAAAAVVSAIPTVAALGAGDARSTIAAVAATAAFEPVTPCRLADTRNGNGVQAITIDSIRIQVTSRCGVPAGATAAVLTVTATRAAAAGFLTTFPAGQAVPTASTLNFRAGQDRANGAIVTLGAGGAVDVYASVPVDVVVDVSGWFRPTASAAAGRFVPLEPRRVFDSRGDGFARPVAAGETITLPIPAGIPTDARALALNVTTTDPNAPGFVTLHPSGTALPEASMLNTDGADQTRAAGVITPVTANGVDVYSKAGGHVVVDITGWFTGPSAGEGTDGLFVPAPAPQRVVDTRGGDPIWHGGEIEVPIGIVGASAVALNVTLVGARSWGFLTAHAARTPIPATSTVNAGAKGETAANFAVIPMSTSGIGAAAHGGGDLVADLAGWFVGTPVPTTLGPPANVRPPVCAPGTSPAALTTFLAGGDPFRGADYQRAFALPDGRTLWLFQDVNIATRTGSQFVHNAGLVQTGNCFEILQSGGYANPGEYLFPTATVRFRRWFWPLGGEMGTDGNFHVFVAEVIGRGSYLDQVEPVATWRVEISLADMSVVDFAPAPDPSAALYGWSVTSDASYTYLYAHCFRQFGWDLFPFTDPPLYAHDWDCTDDVTVARVPRGRLDAAPSYWNGTSWGPSSAAAVPVIPNWDRAVNPAQVRFDGRRFVAVTKEGDWWGDTIYLDVATAAQGPWHTYAAIPVASRCGNCNTYFASFVPRPAADRAMVVSLSNNTFTGPLTGSYSPSFFTVPAAP
jgi:hypothetical protein